MTLKAATPPAKTSTARPGLRGEALRDKIRTRPDWAATSLLGLKLWGKQNDLIKSAFDNQRTAVAGCVSSGKTHSAAALTFLWLYGWGPGSRVFTLAPSYRQVDINLWGEIPRIHRQAPKPLGGKLYQTTEFKLGDDWYALGFSTKEPEMIHGIHGPHDLVIVDDAHAVPEPLFEELENIVAGGQTHIVLLYNPHRLSGTTYKARRQERKLWNPMTISYYDTPNAKAGAVVVPGTLKPDVVEVWKKKYGVDSNFFRVKVLAKDPKQEADAVIPLEWAELAVAREVPEPNEDSPRAYGQDVARFGDDDTTRCEIHGRKTLPLISFNGQDTMKTANQVAEEQSKRPGPCAIDVIGIGSGVYDRLAELGNDVIPVNVSEKSLEVDETGKQRFANLRSQLWWEGREAINPENPEALSLPDDPDLIGELTSAKYTVTKGLITVEPKDAMKKRLGKSPDKADAWNLAVFALKQGSGGGDLMTLVEDYS